MADREINIGKENGNQEPEHGGKDTVTMNRTDFMKQLESLLQNISPAEREEALQYYNEYFNDAGAENEQAVIEALGNPAKVAENIKRDLYGSGYGDVQKNISNERAVVAYQQNINERSQEKEQKMSTGMIVLIVVLCVLASPVILGVGGGLIGTVAGVIASWFAMILGVGAAAITLLLLFLVLVVLGGIALFTDPLVGIALLGGGLVCGGIGILCLMLTIAMAGIATPAVCKWIAGLFKRKPKPEAAQKA